ncbi:MAG: NB-ARC domain-containing protein [Cyanobacteria bacterium P01_C01_bin.121]
MGGRSKQRWFARWVKRLLAWWARVWSRLQGPTRGMSVNSPSNFPITSNPPSSQSQTQVHQDATGNQNVVVGVIEAGARLTVNYGAAPLPSGDPNPFGVPYQRNVFFRGRQAALQRLHQQLNQATTAAITQVQAISGLGGIGKTQTAVEYTYRYYADERVYDTVLWVKAETEITLATDFANIARQLALPAAQRTQEEQIPAVKAWLANHANWLLVFDNADRPEWLLPFWPNNPSGRVLITSRASLFDVVGITQPLVLDVLSLTEACELLFARTAYERTEANQQAAAAINQELDGLPLALEQASAFMRNRRISLSTYLSTYRNRGLTQLDEVKAQIGQYPSSVMRTWALNVQAVSEERPEALELFKFSALLGPDEIPYFLLSKGAIQLGEPLASYLQHEDVDEMVLALSLLLEPLSQYSLIKWLPG